MHSYYWLTKPQKMHPMNKKLRNHTGRLAVTKHTICSSLGGALDPHRIDSGHTLAWRRCPNPSSHHLSCRPALWNNKAMGFTSPSWWPRGSGRDEAMCRELGILTPATHAPLREQGGLSASSLAAKEVQWEGSRLAKGERERAEEAQRESWGSRVNAYCLFFIPRDSFSPEQVSLK